MKMTTWTLKELQAEFEYQVQERLGILCEDREPNEFELNLAQTEAQAVIDELNRQSRQRQRIT
jgi:hypothetical protein